MSREHAHDHEHLHPHDEDEDEDEDELGASAWLRAAGRQTCPACGSSGAFVLGGGLFCPSCGEITKNPGYRGTPSG